MSPPNNEEYSNIKLELIKVTQYTKERCYLKRCLLLVVPSFAIYRRRTYLGVKESLPLVVAVSATGRRSICRTPMEMPPFTRARYCVGYWERLPSTTEGTTIRIYVAKVESRHCFSLYKQNWEYSLLGKERGF